MLSAGESAAGKQWIKRCGNSQLDVCSFTVLPRTHNTHNPIIKQNTDNGPKTLVYKFRRAHGASVWGNKNANAEHVHDEKCLKVKKKEWTWVMNPESDVKWSERGWWTAVYFYICVRQLVCVSIVWTRGMNFCQSWCSDSLHLRAQPAHINLKEKLNDAAFKRTRAERRAGSHVRSRTEWEDIWKGKN